MEEIPKKGKIIQFLCNPGDKRYMQAGVVIGDVLFPNAEIKMIVAQFLWGQYQCEIPACRIVAQNDIGHLQESYNTLIKAYPYLNKVMTPSLPIKESKINEPTPQKAEIPTNPETIMVDELPTALVEASLCQGALF